MARPDHGHRTALEQAEDKSSPQEDSGAEKKLTCVQGGRNKLSTPLRERGIQERTRFSHCHAFPGLMDSRQNPRESFVTTSLDEHRAHREE